MVQFILLETQAASDGRALAMVLGHSSLGKPPVASHCYYYKEKNLFLLGL